MQVKLRFLRVQPSADVVRVEGVECGQSCVAAGARATLCGIGCVFCMFVRLRAQMAHVHSVSGTECG